MVLFTKRTFVLPISISHSYIQAKRKIKLFPFKTPLVISLRSPHDQNMHATSMLKNDPRCQQKTSQKDVTTFWGVTLFLGRLSRQLELDVKTRGFLNFLSLRVQCELDQLL